MNNFILLKNGMQAFDQFSQGVDLLHYLTHSKFDKKESIWTPGDLKIKAISENSYLGYAKKTHKLHNDLLFTKTFFQQILPFISRGLIRVLCAIAANEFNIGKRFREQGDIKSLLIPDTHQQKVLEFCPVHILDAQQHGYILMDVNDSKFWNSHGKAWSQRKALQIKAYQRQLYYQDIYQKGIWLAK